MRLLIENWRTFLSENKTSLGYKVVAYDGKKFRSLQNPNITYDVSIGNVEQNNDGFFLGTTEKFVKDYYLETTDFDDAIITYEYNPENIIKGNPDEEGEIKVRKAKVINIEMIPREEW